MIRRVYSGRGIFGEAVNTASPTREPETAASFQANRPREALAGVLTAETVEVVAER